MQDREARRAIVNWLMPLNEIVSSGYECRETSKPQVFPNDNAKDQQTRTFDLSREAIYPSQAPFVTVIG
jgi:hypothetical protein